VVHGALWKDDVKLGEGSEVSARHARKMIHSYVKWFDQDSQADEISKAAVTILRLMGLFNRPADEGCLKALRESPISGLTEPLFATSNPSHLWNRAVNRLRQARLLAASQGDRSLDCHPLIREHFASQLDEEFPNAACEAHLRLYEHLKESAPELPDNLNDMMPLYHAVTHGCRAGQYSDALWKCTGGGFPVAGSISAQIGSGFGTDLQAMSAFSNTLGTNRGHCCEATRKFGSAADGLSTSSGRKNLRGDAAIDGVAERCDRNQGLVAGGELRHQP